MFRPLEIIVGTFFWYDGTANSTDTPPPDPSHPTSFVSSPCDVTESVVPPTPVLCGISTGVPTLTPLQPCQFDPPSPEAAWNVMPSAFPCFATALSDSG